MEKTSDKFLLEEKTEKLIVNYAVPCIISLLIGALYNIVDQIFIGWGIGYLGNGATSVVFPITILALAIAVMIGDGACSFISINLGKKDIENAHKSAGNAIIVSLLISIILTTIYYIFKFSILKMFGATENNMSFANDYFIWIVAGIPFFMMANTLNPIIRSDGNPKFAMLVMIVGAVINVILDPIAIFVLHWGMAGAGIATILGQIVSAIMSFCYFIKMKTIPIQKNSFILNQKLIITFIPMGFCSFLSQISIVISMAVTNNMLVKYGAMSSLGSDIPLTALGVVMKVFQIFISISVGIAAGCIPVVGFNFGAGKMDRVKRLMFQIISAEALLGLFAFIAIECFPLQIIHIFGTENDLYNTFAIKTMRIFLSMIILACVNKGSFIFLQSLGKAGLSSFLSFFREVIVGVPLVIILPKFYGLDGILYSMPLSDILAFILSLAVVISISIKLTKPSLKLSTAQS